MEIRKVEMYFANDGSRFFTQVECEEYEMMSEGLGKIDKMNKESILWFDNDCQPVYGSIGECVGRGKYFAVIDVAKAKKVFNFCYLDRALCHTIEWDGYFGIASDMELKVGHLYIMDKNYVCDYEALIASTMNEMNAKFNSMGEFVNDALHKEE